MDENVIRPSKRRMRLNLGLAVVLAAVLGWVAVEYREQVAWWVVGVAALPLAGVAAGWLDRRRTALVIGERTVRVEVGFWKKEVREVAASRIRRVTVERTMGQRMYGVGTVVVEGDGVGERVVAADLDQPKKVAERIRNLARVAGAEAGAREWKEKEGDE